MLAKEGQPRGSRGIAFTRRPACKEKKPVPRGRRCACQPRHAIHRPFLEAVFDIISLQPNGARRNHLVCSVIVPNNGSAKTTVCVCSRGLPYCFPSSNIQGQ